MRLMMEFATVELKMVSLVEDFPGSPQARLCEWLFGKSAQAAPRLKSKNSSLGLWGPRQAGQTGGWQGAGAPHLLLTD